MRRRSTALVLALLGTVGGLAGATALAVAVYPNAADARAAAGLVGNVLRTGYSSPRTGEPYARLFGVDSIRVRGDAVVARLTDRGPASVAASVAKYDMPLFWSPPPAG